MKQKILLFTFLFSCFGIFAQSKGDITIYSNTGKKFYVILNGIRQNIQAETNVRISDLEEPWYSCRIMAEDKSFSLEKNVGIKKDSLTTYQIIEKKGKYKLRFFSESSLRDAVPSAGGTHIVYHATETPTGDVGVNATSNDNTQVTNGTSTTTTTTHTSQNTGNGNVSIQINENGMATSVGEGSENIDVNINLSGMDLNLDMDGIESEIDYKETSTTTTSNTTTVNGVTTHSESATVTTTSNGNSTITTEQTTIGNTDEPGNLFLDDELTMTMETTGGCTTTNTDLEMIKKTIALESFESDKMKVAKQLTQHKCMHVSQIKEIVSLFEFESDKLEFLKASYLNCMNQVDYSELGVLFEFDSSKKELEDFIKSR